MWVRSEYAGELAVLTTWLCALLPWSVTHLSGPDLSALTIRFLPARVLYIFGAELPGERPFLFLWQVPGFVGTQGETLASYAWIAGTLAFLVPLGISVAYYLREEDVEARIDPVRVLGLLLVATGLVFLVSVALLWYYIGGLTLPVGVLFQLGLGAVLLRTERV